MTITESVTDDKRRYMASILGYSGATLANKSTTDLENEYWDKLIAGTIGVPKDSPAFTGTPTAPTAAPGTNTTQLATTAFVKGAVDSATSVAARWQTGNYYAPTGPRSTFGHGDGIITYAPLWVPAGAGVDRIGCEVTTAAAATVGRLGLYADNGNGYPASLIVDAGTIDASTTGAKEITIARTLTDVLVWVALVSQGGSAAFRTISNSGDLPSGGNFLSAGTSSTAQSGFFGNGVTGALAATAVVGGSTAPPYLVTVRAT